MEQLLIAIGIPAPAAATIVSFGWGWSITITLGAILARWLLIPFLVKWLEEKRTRTASVMDTLKNINDNIIQSNKNHQEFVKQVTEHYNKNDLDIRSRMEKIQSLIEEVLTDSVGNCDSQLALSTFATYMANIHLRTEIYFWRRVKLNHILENSSIISGRYANEAEKLSNKVITHMSKYHHKSTPLSFFWSKGGIESYLRHMFTELYSIQYNIASGDPEALQITEEILSERIDHNLSILMGAFNRWLDNSELSYTNIKHDYDLKLFGKKIETSYDYLNNSKPNSKD